MEATAAEGERPEIADLLRLQRHALIRSDEQRKAEEQLEAKLLEGLSGAESKLTSAEWRAIRSEASARIQANGKKSSAGQVHGFQVTA